MCGPPWSPARSGTHQEQATRSNRGLGRQSIRVHRAQRCLTTRSRRGPTSKRQARAAAQAIIRSAGLAFCCRSRLSSNVRPHKNRQWRTRRTEQPNSTLARLGTSACGAPQPAAPARNVRPPKAFLLQFSLGAAQQTSRRFCSASRSAKSVADAPPFFQFVGPAAVSAAARPTSLGSGGVQRQRRGGSSFGLLRPPSQGILGSLCSFSPRSAVALPAPFSQGSAR